MQKKMNLRQTYSSVTSYKQEVSSYKQEVSWVEDCFIELGMQTTLHLDLYVDTFLT